MDHHRQQITALTTALTIEDPTRFERSRTVGAYAGLVPRKHESGQLRRELGITKQGANSWRALLVNCAQYILGKRGKDCDLRRIGLAIASRGGPKQKKKAVIAVARRLAVVMHRMLADEKSYEFLRFPDRRLEHAA